MKGAIIYFSGTGNTRYVAEQFKKHFEGYNIQCDLIDIRNKNAIEDIYDYYVFGAPIYAEMMPKYFTDWVKINVPFVKGKRALIFSTPASTVGTGAFKLRKLLNSKGFNVISQNTISMPNNYYVVAFKKSSMEENKEIYSEAESKVKKIVKDFMEGRSSIEHISRSRVALGSFVYKFFNAYSKTWAKKNISVDYDKCIKCGKCEKSCPTGNIKLIEKVEFENKCISCQGCLHICPVNAFVYKGTHFEQYKILK